MTEDPLTDMVAVVPTVLQGEAAVSVAGAIASAAARTTKPLAVSWCPRPGTAEAAKQVLAAAGVPNFPDPVRCVLALAGVVRGATPPADASYAPLIDAPARTFAEHTALDLLREAGIPTLPGRLVATPAEAASAAETFGGPVVLKLQSPDIPHKSDAGGVALNVAPHHATAACASILDAACRAVPGTRAQHRRRGAERHHGRALARLSTRPSINASPAPISAMPARCRGSSASPSTSVPSSSAVTGTSSVTSIVFVAPAPASSA